MLDLTWFFFGLFLFLLFRLVRCILWIGQLKQRLFKTLESHRLSITTWNKTTHLVIIIIKSPYMASWCNLMLVIINPLILPPLLLMKVLRDCKIRWICLPIQTWPQRFVSTVIHLSWSLNHLPNALIARMHATSVLIQLHWSNSWNGGFYFHDNNLDMEKSWQNIWLVDIVPWYIHSFYMI